MMAELPKVVVVVVVNGRENQRGIKVAFFFPWGKLFVLCLE